MQDLVFLLLAIEEQERIDEEREIVDKRDVERAVLVDLRARHAEKLIEERRHARVSLAHWRLVDVRRVADQRQPGKSRARDRLAQPRLVDMQLDQLVNERRSIAHSSQQFTARQGGKPGGTALLNSAGLAA